MISEGTHRDVVAQVSRTGLRGRALRAEAMRALSKLEHYAWSGVYRLEGEELVLDEYVGAPTEHTRIPVGRGVCGTAVAEGRNQVVDDVTELGNYLACSIETKAEIVVLIRDERGTVLGQIDIDGHTARCFDSTDEAMLEDLASLLAGAWE